MQTLVFAHFIKELFDFVSRVHGLHFHRLRVAHELRRQLGNAFGVSRREQQGLSLRRTLLNELFHIVEKTHVQHAVSFIQHQGFDRVQTQVAAREVIQNPSGRADHHMRAVLQALLLTAQGHAAAQRDDFDVGRGTRQPANFCGNLVGQFSRRA